MTTFLRWLATRHHQISRFNNIWTMTMTSSTMTTEVMPSLPRRTNHSTTLSSCLRHRAWSTFLRVFMGWSRPWTKGTTHSNCRTSPIPASSRIQSWKWRSRTPLATRALALTRRWTESRTSSQSVNRLSTIHENVLKWSLPTTLPQSAAPAPPHPSCPSTPGSSSAIRCWTWHSP